MADATDGQEPRKPKKTTNKHGLPRRKPGRRNDICWEDVRFEWEHTNSTDVDLCRKYNIAKPDSIRQKRQLQNWEKGEGISNVVRRNVIDLATRRVMDSIDQDDVVDAISRGLNRCALSQELLDLSGKLLKNTLLRALGHEAPAPNIRLGPTQGETAAILDIIAASSKYIRDIRLDAGIMDGKPTVKQEVDIATEPGHDYIVAVVPQKQPEEEKAS